MGRTVAALTNREKLIRIAKNLLDHPDVKDSPFAPMLNLVKPQLAGRLDRMNERDAKAAIDTLRDIIDA